MSLENYQKGILIIEENKNKCFFAGPRTEELICLAEKTIGLNFSGMYRDFLKRYGAGNFGAQEIFGVIDEDFEESSVPDAIWYTMKEREEINLPENLLIIYETGNGELFCLDFKKLNDFEEPAVVSFYPEIDLINQTYEIIADDFGDLLLDLVSREV